MVALDLPVSLDGLGALGLTSMGVLPTKRLLRLQAENIDAEVIKAGTIRHENLIGGFLSCKIKSTRKADSKI